MFVTILLLNQFFCPDSAATSQMLTDLARELVSRGHAVRVICGGSSYGTAGSTQAPGVEVTRLASAKFGRGKLQRVASYFTYIIPAAWFGLIGKKPDLILSMTTPPGLAVIGGFVAWARGAKHFIWEMDVYMDLVLELEYLGHGRRIATSVGWLIDQARKRADGVITLGECMAERFRGRVHESRVHVAENWADGSVIQETPFQADGNLKILYSGNLGLVHDVGTIQEVIVRLRDNARLKFTFAGGGRKYEELQQFCREQSLPVAFEPHCEREDLTRRLGASDIGLVTQKTEALGCVVPSKTYGIMAAGRPILFVGPSASTTARIIDRFNCGWHVECGDVAGLVALLQLLQDQPELVREAGSNGLRAFATNYDVALGVGRVCDLLDCSSLPARVAVAN